MAGVDWIDVTQDRENWQDLLHVIMDLRIPLSAGSFCLAEEPCKTMFLIITAVRTSDFTKLNSPGSF
jgi:hypothetical protein